MTAIFCVFCVLVCELISRPYTTMGVGDDGPYIVMAKTLATSGHIAYNGWASPMLGWQLYIGAAFIKLFGYSFTAVRMSALIVSLALTFFLQRSLVLAGITERNATLGTLALVLTPLYLMLSVTYMTDIFGLFAIVFCFYGCLRALQASTQRATVLWLCVAISLNVLCGTSRQIAWLGTLVMVPSTLWLLRARRRVLFAGTVLNFAGVLAIFACTVWLQRQPYVIPLNLSVSNFPWVQTLAELAYLFLDIPFLLLPIVALFIPEARQSRPRVIIILSALLIAFFFLATYPSHLRGFFSRLLEPVTGGGGSWVTMHGIVDVIVLPGNFPSYISPWIRVVLTIASIGGILGLWVVLVRPRTAATTIAVSPSWRQLVPLVAPYSAAYLLLLWSNAASSHLFDRYALGLMVVALPCLLLLYQQRVQPQLPAVSMLLIAITSVYGIASTGNTFSFDRARVAIIDELKTSGVADTALDGGWDSNLDVELRYADHINNPRIKRPTDGYTPIAPPPSGPCKKLWYSLTPHINPLYAISFDPHACYGPAPFAPVHYSRWPYRTPGTLYVVRYTPPPEIR
jgi:hypothetical protein